MESQAPLPPCRRSPPGTPGRKQDRGPGGERERPRRSPTRGQASRPRFPWARPRGPAHRGQASPWPSPTCVLCSECPLAGPCVAASSTLVGWASVTCSPSAGSGLRGLVGDGNSPGTTTPPSWASQLRLIRPNLACPPTHEAWTSHLQPPAHPSPQCPEISCRSF